MRRTLWLSAALFLSALALPASSAALAAPEGDEGKPAAPPAASKDAAAAEYLKTLAGKIGKQSDQEAKESIKKLVEIWKDKDVTDATKKSAPDLVAKLARDDKTAVATDAVDSLAEFGAVGASHVLDTLEKTLKAKEPSVDVYKHCFDSLKKLADTKPATVKALQDYLKYKTDDVVGKAADAMSGYRNAPGKVRRALLEELIKQTEGVSSQAKNAKNSAQVQKWQVIGGSVVAALNALSGQVFKDPEEARKWFNDHKGDKSWDST
jgi:hypothetical protein